MSHPFICLAALQVMGTTVKPHPVYRRRPRVDPSKLAVDQLTGDENVTVVNRNTGKRITGAKAPTLRHLQEWLIRNPGFDVDAKWAQIVHKAVSTFNVHWIQELTIRGRMCRAGPERPRVRVEFYEGSKPLPIQQWRSEKFLRGDA